MRKKHLGAPRLCAGCYDQRQPPDNRFLRVSALWAVEWFELWDANYGLQVIAENLVWAPVRHTPVVRSLPSGSSTVSPR